MRRTPYFINAGWDFFFVGGSSVLLFAVLILLGDAVSKESFQIGASILIWTGNWPHFSATLYRLYSRESILEYAGVALVLPVLIAMAIIAGLKSPEVMGSGLVKLYLLWSPYHYAGQSLGVSLLYARRSGIIVHRWERFCLAGFVYACFAFVTTRLEVGTWEEHFLGISYRSLQLPEFFLSTSKIALVLFSLGVLITIRRWSLRSTLPWIAFVPLLAQFSWSFTQPAPIYALFIPFFHSLQYLLITGFMRVSQASEEKPTRVILQWAKSNLICGAFLFWATPILFAVLGSRYEIAKPVIWAAINVHHFIVDGVIWKLRNPKVVTPLMTFART